MGKYLLTQLSGFLLLIVISVAGQSCGRNDYGKIDQEFETITWGGWALQGADIKPGGTAVGDDQYLERTYKGYVITGNAQTTDIDSVVLYRKRQIVFAGQVAEEISKDASQRKIIYRLTNDKYYWIQLIPIDGPEDGTGNDQLLVSDFVNTRQELDKATVYRYVRTNLGKRPW